MSYESFIGSKSAIKEAHNIIVQMYNLAGSGDEVGFYSFLLNFLEKSNMAFLPAPTNVNVLIRMDPESQPLDENEEKCLYQSSIIDSMHDFGKLGITSDELKSYPSKSDNYTFTGMMFTLMQNTLYRNPGRHNELSGSYFSSFKASFVDINKYQNKVTITSDIEDYILLLSIKRGLLKYGALNEENIKDETQQCFKITKSISHANEEELIAIRTEIEEFFEDFRDTGTNGTQKLNILIDTIKNFKRVLTINDGKYPFAHITTRESIHDSAISKTSPLSPNDAKTYYDDNIFCEVPVRVSDFPTTLDGESDVRIYNSSLNQGEFNSIFNIKLGGIKYKAASGRESLSTVSEYEYNGVRESFNSILNQSRHPTNTTTVLNEVKTIKSKTSLFLSAAQRTAYRANWGNFDYIYNNIFKELNYKDDETTFKYSFYYTKKRAGDGLQAEVCRRVTNKQEVIRAYKIKTGSGDAIANLSKSTTYILENLILVTQDRALFSVCITNGVPAILSTYTSYILFKPKSHAISESMPPVPESAPETTPPVPESIPVPKSIPPAKPSKLKKGGAGNLYDVNDVGSDIVNIIHSSRDPIYFFRIFQKIIARTTETTSGTILTNPDGKKYIEYIENFEMKQKERTGEISESMNNEPVFGIYEFLKEHRYVLDVDRDVSENWEIIECLYNLKIPEDIILHKEDQTPVQTINEPLSTTTYTDIYKFPKTTIDYFDVNARDGETLIANINLRDESYNPYSIFLGFQIGDKDYYLKVVKNPTSFTIDSNSPLEFNELTYRNILEYARFGSHKAMTRNSLKEFLSRYSDETDIDIEEAFFRDISQLMDLEELHGEPTRFRGGSPFKLNVSFTSLPLLNYYILLFYNLPILVNESANNLVMLSYLNIFENFELFLCLDDELIEGNFDNGSLFTNKKLLYLFFYHLIDDYGVENVSYNMLEYFLKNHHLDLYFDLYLVIGYVYGLHQLFIPFTPSDLIEKNIQSGLIKLDDISNTQAYFESIYRKSLDSNIDEKYFTRNGFMFMSRIFVEKITVKETNEKMDVKHKMEKVKDEMDDVKHEVEHVNHEMDHIKHEMDDVKHEMEHPRKSRSRRGTSESKRIAALEKKLKKMKADLKSKRMSKSKASKTRRSSKRPTKRFSKSKIAKTLKLEHFDRTGLL
jgi:hypothetical protein